MHKEISAAQQANVYQVSRTIRLLLTLATALIGFTTMIATISFRPVWSLVLDVWTPDVHHSMYRLVVLCGFFLLMLSPGLARGKRGAWRVTLFLLGLSLAQYLFFSRQVEMTILTALLTILLTVSARHFQTRSDPPSVRRGSLALLMGLGIVLLYTLYGMLILHPRLEQGIDRSGFETILFRLLTNTHMHVLPGTRIFFFGRALPMLCLSAVLYGIGQILRPVASTLFPTEQQRQAVTTILHRYGNSSISYFALGRDKSYFFTDCGRAVISYVLVGNVAVVAGDPLGPSEAIAPAIEQFLAFCQKQDWRVVFWQVRDQLTECYQRAGLHLLKIGEDAVLPMKTFTLAGKAMANVRTSARRAEKAGMHVVFWQGSIQDMEQRAQVEQISRSWLARRGGREMGFSMGRFEMTGQRELLFALAVDPMNRVHAFVTFVPIYGRLGWALDLMRRAESSCPGTMEYLLAHAISSVRTQGAEMVSLGLAPLSDVNISEQTLLGKGIEVLAQHTGHPRKQQALFAFKKKFHPCWESRYLAYSSTLALPKVGWALYRAHQPDGPLLLAFASSLRERCRRERVVQKHTANAFVH